MDERITDGAHHEAPPSRAPAANYNPEREASVARLQRWRASALWSMVAGFGMLFMGASFSTSILIGGVGMIVGSSLLLGYCALALRRLRDDPWNDAELDAWEREEMLGRR